jgi:hypothetical protein
MRIWLLPKRHDPPMPGRSQREPVGDAAFFLDCREQHHAAIRGDASAIEGGSDLFFLQMPVISARGISGICINNISNYTTIINHNLTSHNKIVAE